MKYKVQFFQSTVSEKCKEPQLEIVVNNDKILSYFPPAGMEYIFERKFVF